MDGHFIEMREVSKAFGKVLAMDRVCLHVDDREVVGLVGDNGAGKSTLIRILSGVLSPDSGELRVLGNVVRDWSVAKAREAGIETVYQDKALAPNQSISRNIFMGREICGPLGFVRLRRQREETDRLMRSIGFTSKVFSPESLVGALSGGEREGVAIARAMYFKASLIILDEPTTALSLTESEKVFGFVRTARERGASCIFISHNIYHVYDIADRFVLLDRGRVVGDVSKKEVHVEDLIKGMQHVAKTGQFVLA
jgi:simple sugar transport system ATP-binding protein